MPVASVVVTPLAYSPKDAAKVIGRTRSRVYELIASGEIRARKDGRNTVIEHDELVRFIASLPEREMA